MQNNESKLKTGASNHGCLHYRRQCKLISPCCHKTYVCRLCHDEVESHSLDRKKVEKVECMNCGSQQPVSKICENCENTFAEYFCEICHLFDNTDKGQFHCNDCGICRVGGRENFFHCKKCALCLPKSMEFSHKCIESSSRRNCPVCLEDIHTSRIPAHVPPCGHLLHTTCYKDMLKAGHSACSICGESMEEMKQIWEELKKEVESTPMPDEYKDLYCKILCKDCHKETHTQFHILGLSCIKCNSFNTTRADGPLLTRTAVPSSDESTEEQNEIYVYEEAIFDEENEVLLGGGEDLLGEVLDSE